MKTIKIECPACQQHIELEAPPAPQRRLLPALLLSLAAVAYLSGWSISFRPKAVATAPKFFVPIFCFVPGGPELPELSNRLAAIQVPAGTAARMTNAATLRAEAAALLKTKDAELRKIEGEQSAALQNRVCWLIDLQEQRAIAAKVPASDRIWYMIQALWNQRDAQDAMDDATEMRRIQLRRDLADQEEEAAQDDLLKVDALKKKRDGITAELLRRMQAEVDETTNASPPLTETQKKAKAQAEYDAAYKHAYAIKRERDAVRSSAIETRGSVFQILSDGMLFNAGPPINELIRVDDVEMNGLSDGSPMHIPAMWQVGSYRYGTASGSTRTVKRYTMDLDRAIQWHRDNPAGR